MQRKTAVQEKNVMQKKKWPTPELGSFYAEILSSVS